MQKLGCQVERLEVYFQHIYLRRFLLSMIQNPPRLQEKALSRSEASSCQQEVSFKSRNSPCHSDVRPPCHRARVPLLRLRASNRPRAPRRPSRSYCKWIWNSSSFRSPSGHLQVTFSSSTAWFAYFKLCLIRNTWLNILRPGHACAPPLTISCSFWTTTSSSSICLAFKADAPSCGWYLLVP